MHTEHFHRENDTAYGSGTYRTFYHKTSGVTGNTEMNSTKPEHLAELRECLTASRSLALYL